MRQLISHQTWNIFKVLKCAVRFAILEMYWMVCVSICIKTSITNKLGSVILAILSDTVHSGRGWRLVVKSRSETEKKGMKKHMDIVEILAV